MAFQNPIMDPFAIRLMDQFNLKSKIQNRTPLNFPTSQLLIFLFFLPTLPPSHPLALFIFSSHFRIQSHSDFRIPTSNICPLLFFILPIPNPKSNPSHPPNFSPSFLCHLSSVICHLSAVPSKICWTSFVYSPIAS